MNLTNTTNKSDATLTASNNTTENPSVPTVQGDQMGAPDWASTRFEQVEEASTERRDRSPIRQPTENEADNSQIQPPPPSGSAGVSTPITTPVPYGLGKVVADNAQLAKTMSELPTAQAKTTRVRSAETCPENVAAKKPRITQTESQASLASRIIKLGMMASANSLPLTTDQMQTLKSAILKSTLTCASPGLKPRFKSCVATTQFLMIECIGENAAEWVRRFFNKIKEISRLDIELLEADKFPKQHFISGFFFNSLDFSNEKVLAYIDVQNDISTKDWKIVERTFNGSKLRIVFSIDAASLEALLNCNGKIYYCFGRVKLNLKINYDETTSTINDATENRPPNDNLRQGRSFTTVTVNGNVGSAATSNTQCSRPTNNTLFSAPSSASGRPESSSCSRDWRSGLSDNWSSRYDGQNISSFRYRWAPTNSVNSGNWACNNNPCTCFNTNNAEPSPPYNPNLRDSGSSSSMNLQMRNMENSAPRNFRGWM